MEDSYENPLSSKYLQNHFINAMQIGCENFPMLTQSLKRSAFFYMLLWN